MASPTSKPERAIRAELRGTDPETGVRDRIVATAGEVGLLGWVRRDPDGAVRVHAEGEASAVAALLAFLDGIDGAQIAVADVAPEGHEQFAIRGVSAGRFVVAVREGERGFELALEVDGAFRSWTLPKGPSMDPAVKRMAIAAPDRDLADPRDRAWDRGSYEQGGRVPWPEAIERGHAVFVLCGERLRGGFALQRTGGGSPRWLLIKRRDEWARPGSEVVAEAEG